MKPLDVWFDREVRNKTKAAAYAAGLSPSEAADQARLVNMALGGSINYTGDEIEAALRAVESSLDPGFVGRLLRAIGR